MSIFRRKKEIDPLAPIGFLDSKPFPYLNDGLEYAKDRIVIKKDNYLIRTRVLDDVLFKFTLVEKLPGFILEETTSKYLKANNLLTLEEQEAKFSVNIYVINTYNEEAINFAKANTVLTKKGFQQILLYNHNEVRLDYFNVLPEFDFNLMKYYRIAVYFDLACYDQEDY